MDNWTIESCIAKDSEIRQVFAGCLLEDDVRHIIGASRGDSAQRLHNLRIFLCNTMLYRNIEHFPLAFVLNTGTHKNGGTHWQSMYIDHEHTVYFFDSYGRKPSDIFHRFAHDLLTISYYREYTKDLPLKEALSDSRFTQTNLHRCHKTKEANDEEDTIRYFPYQIQNDKTNVCGEYAVLFLHNITRTRDPWMHAYEFWTEHQDVFFLLPTSNLRTATRCPCCCTTTNNTKTTQQNKALSSGQAKTQYQNQRLYNNDMIVRDMFSKLYNVKLSKNLLS